ncbi:MAG: 5-deoxy-glucuronate isomerase [Chlamydiae bacterium]|nr:5-deoxy-glucuronate isomerase [Chlamydiota bacterium]
MTRHLKNHRQGFPQGITLITQDHDETGITFSIIKLKAGESYRFTSRMETAILQMAGTIECKWDNQLIQNTRNSLFDEQPLALHVPNDTQVTLKAITDCECTFFETANDKQFPAVIYSPEGMVDEHRGKGLVEDTSLRFVRTIFDGSNSHPNTELVLGEVVNFPGRWSSYPPHHHPQPEIYHYRFSKPTGYGHAELGEDVMKVRQYDTIKILDELDHAQCSAPGYGMYYIWVIRHLERNRYTVPEFTEEHRWTMEPAGKI